MLKWCFRGVFLVTLLTASSLLVSAQTAPRAKPTSAKTKKTSIRVRTPSVVESPAEIKRQITAVYADIDRASKVKDVTGITKYYAPDFIQANMKGAKVSYAQTVDSIKEQLANAESVEAQTTILNLTAKGNTVTVDIDIDSTIVSAPPGGSKNTLQILGTAREFWVKTKQGWQRKRSRVTSEKIVASADSVSS